jgi:hypothetical protein
MVPITLRTRKPVDQLTRRDFATFPVWEYASDEEGIAGRDETWVRPVDTTVVPNRRYTLVGADFTAACGKEYAGSVTVSTLDGDPEISQGAILYKGKSLFISSPENFFFRESLKQLLAALGLKKAEIFPLSFRLRVPVAGYPKYAGGVLPDPKKPSKTNNHEKHRHCSPSSRSVGSTRPASRIITRSGRYRGIRRRGDSLRRASTRGDNQSRIAAEQEHQQSTDFEGNSPRPRHHSQTPSQAQAHQTCHGDQLDQGDVSV